jgi:hypothetical protein
VVVGLRTFDSSSSLSTIAASETTGSVEATSVIVVPWRTMLPCQLNVVRANLCMDGELSAVTVSQAGKEGVSRGPIWSRTSA